MVKSSIKKDFPHTIPVKTGMDQQMFGKLKWLHWLQMHHKHSKDPSPLTPSPHTKPFPFSKNREKRLTQ